MSLLPRLLFLAIGASALLIGIQLPNFVDQYEKRLDAHLIEVRTNLKPFQDIAGLYHGGSIEALIQKHEQSTDATFKAEAVPIRRIYERFLRFQNETIQLKTSLPKKLLWIATGADRELVDETRRNYSFGLQLDSTAVLAGIVLMAVAVLLMELLAALMRLLLPNRRPSRSV